MDILLTNKEIEFAIDEADNEFGYWLQVYNIQTGARLKRGKRPVKEDFTSAAIAKAQLKKVAEWLESVWTVDFEHGCITLPFEAAEALKEAANG